MRSRMAPQDEGVVLFDVDNIPISAILRSLFTQEGTLPERSVAGWRGGACAGGVPLRRPGRPPESGLAQRASTQNAWKAVSLPALDYAGAVSESALRRDGEGRSPMDPLRVTGSVGRGVKSSRLCGRWVFVRAGRQGQPCAPELDETPAPGTKDTPPERDGATSVPAKGGATFPRGIGGVTAPMPVGPFAPESKTGVPKIAERGAPGRHPSLI